MGPYQSIPIKADEIPSYIQRNDWCRLSLITEPARFNEPKPYELHYLSDDNWAALALRVDPLARCVLDPRRNYIGAAFLSLLMTCVFSAVRSTLNRRTVQNLIVDDLYFSNYTIDDYYDSSTDDENIDLDDIVLAETRYRQEEINVKLMHLRFIFAAVLLILVVSTVMIAIGMEQRNIRNDQKIEAVCDEMRPRFESEGFSVEYRTRIQSGAIGRYLCPERVIIFKRLTEASPRNIHSSPHHTNNFQNIDDTSNISNVNNSPYSTFMVQVPRESLPGDVIKVSTPSGRNIMVSVPLGVRPGQQFPVLIPPRFQLQLVSPICGTGV